MTRQGRWRTSALTMFAAGILFFMSPARAAEWITGYSDTTTEWVTDIEHRLNSDEYRALFVNDPRTPQASVMLFLNSAARAHEANDPLMAASLIEKAVQVLEAGVTRHYYSKADIAPIVRYIEKMAPKEGS